MGHDEIRTNHKAIGKHCCSNYTVNFLRYQKGLHRALNVISLLVTVFVGVHPPPLSDHVLYEGKCLVVYEPPYFLRCYEHIQVCLLKLCPITLTTNLEVGRYKAF